MKFKRKQSGFSLIELMVVVSIIGILATVMGPKMVGFSAKARQAEAKTNLGTIYTLENVYNQENGQFVDLTAYGRGTCAANTLGFTMDNCTSKYAYAVTGSSQTAFTATATSDTGANNKIIPGCATADVWNMNATQTLTNSPSAVTSCP